MGCEGKWGKRVIVLRRRSGTCATYSGKGGVPLLLRSRRHILKLHLKNERDLRIHEALCILEVCSST